MRPFLKPRSLWCRAAQINSILIDDLASELISQKLPHFAFELPVGSMEALSTTVPCRSIPALVAVETSAPSVTASTIARVDLRGARVDLVGMRIGGPDQLTHCSAKMCTHSTRPCVS